MEESFTKPQLFAIIKQTKIGKVIRDQFPEIADDFREGLTYKQIIQKYSLFSRFDVSENVMRGGLKCAIRGYKGELGDEPYGGLIQDESELERLTHKRYSAAGSEVYRLRIGVHGRSKEEMILQGHKTGVSSRDNCLGFFARTPKQRKEDKSKGGMVTKEKGVGIFSLSKEQRQELARKNVKKALNTLGYTRWTNEELDFAYQLSQKLEYKLQQGMDSRLIATLINEKFHGGESIRNMDTVKPAMYRYRKQHNLPK